MGDESFSDSVGKGCGIGVGIILALIFFPIAIYVLAGGCAVVAGGCLSPSRQDSHSKPSGPIDFSGVNYTLAADGSSLRVHGSIRAKPGRYRIGQMVVGLSLRGRTIQSLTFQVGEEFTDRLDIDRRLQLNPPVRPDSEIRGFVDEERSGISVHR